MRAAVGFVVAAWVIGLSLPGMAEEQKAAPAPESAGKAAPQMIVVKDPQTGELRAPTAAEAAALKALPAAKPAPKAGVAGQKTTVEKLLSGRVRAKLGPEYMRYSVVTKNPDGSLSYDCVPESKVEGALKAPATKSTTATALAPKAEEK